MENLKGVSDFVVDIFKVKGVSDFVKREEQNFAHSG
jgi:hypothetical protein